MHNKIIRRLSCVGISLFLGFGCCFFNPIADLSAVRSLIVHADENTVNKDGFTAILWAVMSSMGVSAYCSGKNIKDISDSVVNQFDKYAATAGLMGSYAVMQGTKVVDGAVSLSKDAYNSVSSFVQNVTDLFDWKPIDGVYPSNAVMSQYYTLAESSWNQTWKNARILSNGQLECYSVGNGVGNMVFSRTWDVTKNYTIALSSAATSDFCYISQIYDTKGYVKIENGASATFTGEYLNKYFTNFTVSISLNNGENNPSYGLSSNYLTISDVTGLDDKVIGTGNAKLDDRVLDAAGDVSLDFGSDALSNTATLDDVIDIVNTWQLDQAWPADYPLAKDTSIPIPTAIPTAIPTTVPTAIPTAVPTTDPFPDGTTGSDYGVLGLQDVFPFCIPFDLYNILTAFCATPETPEFTWESPYGNVSFDFHKFDDLAFWWRKALVILFLIWLLQSSRSSSLGD